MGRRRCRRHGGAAPSHRVKAAREQAAQEVAVAERELELVDATDVLEVALALAHHRSVRFQERFGAQLDGGDLALLGVEGELIERAARIAKIALAEGLDEHQTRRLQRAGEALTAIFKAAIAAAPAELQPETRARMLAVFIEGIERLERTTPERA